MTKATAKAPGAKASPIPKEKDPNQDPTTSNPNGKTDGTPVKSTPDPKSEPASNIDGNHDKNPDGNHDGDSGGKISIENLEAQIESLKDEIKSLEPEPGKRLAPAKQKELNDKKAALSEVEEIPVYGNKDPERKFPFPFKERNYYHLKFSRDMKTPSNKIMEDPGSIKHAKYHREQFEQDSHFKHFQKMGLNVAILHDPTSGEEVQF